jgi:hypothetical protein
MSVRRIKAGSTDVSITLKIIDSADGTPETGVVFNTSGIDLWYRREGAASTDITEATLAAMTTAHTDGGFLHINDGVYRLDLPDAACASGVAGVQIGGTVTGMIVLAPYIELPVNTAEDVFTRVGAPAGASVSADMAAVKVDTAAILVDTGTTLDARIPAALVSGRMDASVGAMAANVLTATAINADALTAAKFAADVTTEFQSGLATAAALATVDGIVDSILVDTAEIGAAGAGLTALATQTSVNDLPTNSELATALAAADDAVLSAVATVDGIVDAILLDTAEIGAAGAGLTAVPWVAPTADGAHPTLGIIDQGTAQSASATGIVLRSAAAFADNTLIGATIFVFGSTQGYWQSRVITDNALSGDSVTVDTWTVTPSGTITYKIFGSPPGSTTAPIPADLRAVMGNAFTGSTKPYDTSA